MDGFSFSVHIKTITKIENAAQCIHKTLPVLLLVVAVEILLVAAAVVVAAHFRISFS